MTHVELTLPDGVPITLRVDAIDSIVFQSGQRDESDEVAITISSWPKPLVYRGKDAKSFYQKIKAALKVTAL
jgi:hypothetical protein